MTDPRIRTAPHHKAVEFIAEAFHAATIALVAVLGIVTVAASI